MLALTPYSYPAGAAPLFVPCRGGLPAGVTDTAPCNIAQKRHLPIPRQVPFFISYYRSHFQK